MKKPLSLLIALLCVATLFAGCQSKLKESTTIKVGASPSPHAEILKAAIPELEKLGYTLEVIEFSDYIQPNLALDSGDLDANYFQHQPYLDDFNVNNKTELSGVAKIHFEPIGIYAGKTKVLADLQDGATIGVPNDTTNEARALLLLEANGLITLKKDAGLLATVKDIEANPKNLVFKELEAATLPRLLVDLDLGVINGNYAIDAGLNASTDALAMEDKESDGATTFANVLAVKKGNEESEATKALIKALTSETIRGYITDSFSGAVIPTF